jgi:hypothetical protein
MSRSTTEPCFACESGTVRPTNLMGTRLRYKDEPDLLVSRDIVVPRCDACEEMPLSAKETRHLSRLLEELRTERKHATLASFVKTVEKEFPDVPRYEWEEAFGLSKGYLSRLMKTRVMDTPLEILLSGIAHRPKEGVRLLALTRALPPALSRAVRKRSLA